MAHGPDHHDPAHPPAPDPAHPPAPDPAHPPAPNPAPGHPPTPPPAPGRAPTPAPAPHPDGEAGIVVVGRGIKKIGTGIGRALKPLSDAATINYKNGSTKAKIGIPLGVIAAICGWVYNVMQQPSYEVIAPMDRAQSIAYATRIADPNNIEVHDEIAVDVQATNMLFVIKGASAESNQRAGQTINAHVQNPNATTPLPYYKIIAVGESLTQKPVIKLLFTFEEKGRVFTYETDELTTNNSNPLTFNRDDVNAHLISN